MYQVHYLNPISPKGTALWTENYTETENVADAQAIMVRSAAMHDMKLLRDIRHKPGQSLGLVCCFPFYKG